MKQKDQSKTFVLGDLHGNYRGLKFLLEKTNFDYENDFLYFVGDICDGMGNESYKCMVELLKIKNFFPCLGNHDIFLKKWGLENYVDKRWIGMDGEKTMVDFLSQPDYKTVLSKYFEKVKYYYLIKDTIICHAGFNLKKPVDNQKELVFAINRDLYKKAVLAESQNIKLKIRCKKQVINKIIIGHTPTKNNKPHFVSNVLNLDTGSARKGCLTIFNIKTKEYYQSTLTEKIYSSSYNGKTIFNWYNSQCQLR